MHPSTLGRSIPAAHGLGKGVCLRRPQWSTSEHPYRLDVDEIMKTGALFRDRREAGRALAKELSAYSNSKDVVILALPRGGVPVAFEVAQELRVPLDVLIVRKVGTPGQKELAMGAIASGNVRVINESVVKQLGIPWEVVEEISEQERHELDRRERVYRGDRAAVEVLGKTCVVIDDGIATGATMRAAVIVLKQLGAQRLIVAAPTAAHDTYITLCREADEVVCLATPEPYIAVGVWYDQFAQTSDEEVCSLLARAAECTSVNGQFTMNSAETPRDTK